MGVIYFFIIITTLVFVHELGHFIFARIFGVQVLEFAIGIGPMIFGFRKGGVLYRFNIFPIGGYVRLAGEDPHGEENLPEDRLFYRKPPWQKIMISSAGPLFSILAGYLAFIFAVAVWGYSPVVVDRVEDGSPAFRAGIKRDDIILDVNGKRIFEISDFVEMVRKNDELRVGILRNGRRMELNVKPALIPAEVELVVEGKGEIPSGKLIGVNDLPLDTNGDEIYKVLSSLVDQKVSLKFENGEIEGVLRRVDFTPPRKAVGIYFRILSPVIQKSSEPFKSGDRIIKIGPWDVKDGVDLSRIFTLFSCDVDEGFILRLSGGKVYYSMVLETDRKYSVEVLRNGEKLVLDFDYKTLKRYLTKELLFSTGIDRMKPGLFRSLIVGVAMTNNFLGKMGRILGSLITGRTGLNNFVGPVGLVSVIGNVARYGVEPLVMLTAIITLNLGLINLFPLPALDGGRIAFAFVELVTRRRLNPQVENYIHMIGFILLMAFMVYVTYVDILRTVGR